MKKIRLTFLVIIVVSLSIGFLGGWLTPRNTQFPHDEALFRLDAKFKRFLDAAKDNLGKGMNFKVKVDGVDVSASKSTRIAPPFDPPNELKYLLLLPDTYKSEFPDLTGVMILRKVDATHVDVVFRPGYLQIGFLDIAICADHYDIGDIQWISRANSLGQP